MIDYKIISMRCTEKQRFLSAVYKHATMVWSELERSSRSRRAGVRPKRTSLENPTEKKGTMNSLTLVRSPHPQLLTKVILPGAAAPLPYIAAAAAAAALGSPPYGAPGTPAAAGNKPKQQ